MALRHLVVVIPGIGGSVLERPDGTPVWGHSLPGLVAPAVSPSRLSLEEAPVLRPVGLLRSTRVLPWKTVPGYDGLVHHLANTFRLSDTDVVTAGQDRPGASIVLFPYDFRRGISEAAADLDREITARLSGLTMEAKAQRVIVLAHSLGGLIARYWLGPLGGAPLCRALITIGTPHRGAPKALDWLLNGVRLGRNRAVRAVSGKVLGPATEVLQGWDSTYDLLPRYRAILDTSGTTLYPHELPVGSAGFRARAETSFAMHARIEESWSAMDDAAPEVLALFARGHPTASRAELLGGRVVVEARDAEWQPNVGWFGDGTVPALSAVPIELSDVVRARRPVPDRHGPMASSAAVVDALRDYEAESMSALRGDQLDRPWLGLDVDDVVEAGEPVPLTVDLLGTDDTGSATAWARLEPEPPGAGPVPEWEQMSGSGPRWDVVLGGRPPGIYRLTVQVVGVPAVDSVVGHEVIGMVAT